jgi:hypothetical protein
VEKDGGVLFPFLNSSMEEKYKMKTKKIRKNRLKLLLLYYGIAIILLIQGITFSKYLITAKGEATINTSKFAFKITDELSSFELKLDDTITSNVYSEEKLVPRK